MPPRASARVASTAASSSAASDTKPDLADGKVNSSLPAQNTNNNNNNNNAGGSAQSAEAESGAGGLTDKDGEDKAAEAGAGGDGEAGDGEGAAAGGRTRKRRLDVNPNLIISEERSKRRRTPSHEPEDRKPAPDGDDPKDPERAKALGEEIVKKILDVKESDGTPIAEPFIKLPSKRQYPDYYEQIKHPFSLEMVQAKLKSGEYQTLKEVINDLGQIFNNAKRYNMKDSDLFLWAKKLHKMTRTFYLKSTRPHDHSDSEEPEARRGSLAPGSNARASVDVGDEDVDMGGPSNASADGETAEARQKRRGVYMRDGPTTYKLIKPVLKSIRDAKSRDGAGRDIAEIFEELPDKKLFQDYYQAIAQPISLQEIEEKMVARRYETTEQFMDDIDLMCKNAMHYNEDDSDVFRDALQIKDILSYHRNDIKKRITAYHSLQQKAKPAAPPAAAAPARPNGPAQGQQSQTPSVPPPSLPQMPQTATQNGRTMPQAPSRAPPQVPPPAPPVTASYLPALPQGVVTEEIVATLDRYPLYEQQAWATSLPPLAMQVYRQMLAANATRKRIADAQAAGVPPPLAEPLSAARPVGPTTPMPDRTAPPLPAIKCLDFTFSAAGEEPEYRQAIRLFNLRGVVTHAVVVGSSTSEIELTAYINSPKTSPHAAARPSASTKDTAGTEGAITPGGSQAGTSGPTGLVAAIEGVPEVSLRVNGNPGTLAKFVYPKGETEKPHGMRWTITLPAGRLETKIDVVATKPGSMAETCGIYISRQF